MRTEEMHMQKNDKASFISEDQTAVLAELENVGGWPNWGANAYLCTAHILMAFALCYDWLYNNLTAEEKSKIVAWICAKGLQEAVLEAVPTVPLPTSPNPSVQPCIEEQKLCIHLRQLQSLCLTVEFIPLKKAL